MASPHSTLPRMPTERRGALASTALILAFLVAGLVTLGDFGWTWDEDESYEAGRANVRLIRAVFTGEPAEWPWHELKGYQFVLDTVRAGFALPFEPWLGSADARPWHLFNLLLAAGVLWGVRRLAWDVTGNAWTAAWAVAALALTPKFVAHSQNNPKDLAGAFAFVWVLWAAERAVRRGRRDGFLLAGGVLGLALANHVIAATFVVIVAWSWWRRVSWRMAAWGAAVAGVVAFAAWPWLWRDPIPRAASVLTRTAEFSTGVRTLFLGESYRSSETPPYYFAVCLVLSTPVLLLMTGLAGAVFRPADAGHRRLRDLGLVAAAVFIFAEACAPAHYDGVRHGLPVLPALALLAAVAIRRVAALGRRGLAVVVAGAGWLLVQLGLFHPYHDAYLNEPMQLAWRGRGEEQIDLEYWGSSFKEGAAWLNTNVRGPAVIVMPLAPHCATPYLRHDLEGRLRPEEEPSGRPHYLMVMTRRGLYPRAVQEAERRLTPLHTIARPSGTLLKIYRLPGPGGP